MSRSRGVPLELTSSDRARFARRVVETETCSVWMGAVGADGYGRFSLSSAGTGRTVTPHQVALTLGGQNVVSGATVLHDCDVRLCCRVGVGHVRASTQRENMRQAAARGHARGPRPGWVDLRGPVGLSRAIQAGIRTSPDRSRSGLAAVLADVLAVGHPLCDHPVLFDVG